MAACWCYTANPEAEIWVKVYVLCCLLMIIETLMESQGSLPFAPSVPAGYLKLSAFQGKFPEVATFRRFAALNAQNILYMQAELSHLELELKEIIHDDYHSGNSTKKAYNQDWWTMNQTSKEGVSSPQMRKILEIREKLQAYSMEFFSANRISPDTKQNCSRCCTPAAK